MSLGKVKENFCSSTVKTLIVYPYLIVVGCLQRHRKKILTVLVSADKLSADCNCKIQIKEK